MTRAGSTTDASPMARIRILISLSAASNLVYKIVIGLVMGMHPNRKTS